MAHFKLRALSTEAGDKARMEETLGRWEEKEGEGATGTG